MLLQQGAHLGRSGEEELTPLVDKVHATMGEGLVEFVLERDRVLGEKQGVYIVPKRH